MTNQFKTVIFLLIVIVLAVLTYQVLKPSVDNTDNNPAKVIYSTDNSTAINIQLIISIPDQEPRNYLISFSEGQSLEQILNNFANNNNSFSYVSKSASFGTFITTFNGKEADSNKEFWNFRVNGADSSVGISDFKPQNSDQIEFILAAF